MSRQGLAPSGAAATAGELAHKCVAEGEKLVSRQGLAPSGVAATAGELAHKCVAEGEKLVSRQGLEPRTRRLRVCCSAS